VTASRAAPRPTVILATLAAVAIALAVCATAATVIVASDVTKERERARQQQVTALLSIEQARASLAIAPSLREAIDSLVAPLAPFTAADSATIALMTSHWGNRASERRDPFAVPADLDLPADVPTVTAADLARALGALGGDSVADRALVARVLADTATSWLASWRRFARSTPLPAFWGYRDHRPGVATLERLPRRSYTGVRLLAQLNELAGRAALERGDAEAALVRGLENAAASRHYLDSPILADFLVGRVFAVGASRLVGDAARALGDEATRARAQSLLALASPAGGSFLALRRAAEHDAASPAGTLAWELFDDDKLPFAVRVEILYATITGACNHTREVLFGFDPERERRLVDVATRHGDHPVMGPLLGLLPETARRVRETPAALLPPSVWPTAGMLDALLPEAVAARAVLCRQF
jgi:hypothetical protein